MTYPSDGRMAGLGWVVRSGGDNPGRPGFGNRLRPVATSRGTNHAGGRVNCSPRSWLLGLLLVSRAGLSQAQTPDSKKLGDDAYQRAQTQRDNHQLLDARDALRICSQPSCRQFIIKDCTDWLTDVRGRRFNHCYPTEWELSALDSAPISRPADPISVLLDADSTLPSVENGRRGHTPPATASPPTCPSPPLGLAPHRAARLPSRRWAGHPPPQVAPVPATEPGSLSALPPLPLLASSLRPQPPLRSRRAPLSLAPRLRHPWHQPCGWR